MRVLKLSALFAIVIVVAICGETTNKQDKPASILIDKSHCKRETETDKNLRENKTKVLLGLKKPTIIHPLVTIAKSLNSLGLSSSNIIPKRHTVPIINRKTIAPTKPTKINEYFDIPSQDNDSKINNDSEINEKPIEKTQTVESSTLKKADSCIGKETEKTKKEPAQVTPEIVTKEHIITESDKVNDGETELMITKETKGSISQETDLSESLVTEFKTYHKTMLNKPSAVTKESRRATEVDSEVILGDNAIPIHPEVADIIEPKMYHFESPLSIKPKINLTEKNIEDSTDLTQQKKVEDKDNKMQVKNESDVTLNFFKTEADDEIDIQNNNYEEPFESSSTPQYLNPKLIATEWRPAENLNYINSRPNPTHQHQPAYDKLNMPLRYDEYNNDKKPYLYDIRKYPVQYVVNMYDGIRNGNNNGNFNDTLYTTNANQWNQKYSSYYQQQASFGQRGDFYNYNQGQRYPNRIWRAWKNNQIIIKPKASKAGNNKDLYARGYFANARNIPVYNNVVICPYDLSAKLKTSYHVHI